MECARHSGKRALGYCKKCGTLGCEECLTRVNITGDKYSRSKTTEILLCHDCLNKARSGLTPQKGGKRPSKKASPRTRAKKQLPKSVKTAAVAVVALVAVVAAAVVLPRVNLRHRFLSPERVVAEALKALSVGNPDAFFSCVDVRGFVCGMDSTGLTNRDYERAGIEARAELVASHSKLLANDFFRDANLRRDFKVIECQVKEDSASVSIQPWVQYGNKLYKRILLEKTLGGWKVTGVASPDY